MISSKKKKQKKKFISSITGETEIGNRERRESKPQRGIGREDVRRGRSHWRT